MNYTPAKALTEMNYKRNARYFTYAPLDETRILLIILGVLLLGSGIGIFILIMALRPYFRRPSDEEIDLQAQSLVPQLRRKALEKLGIDEDEITLAQPIEMWGYSIGKCQLNYGEAGGTLCDILGKDKVWRSPEVEFNAMYFTEETILHYRWIVSLVSNSFKETTNELFYDDIVSIKVESVQSPVLNRNTGQVIPGKIANFEAFSIRNTGGENFECKLRDSSNIEASVKGFRSLLKERKKRSNASLSGIGG